MPESIKSFANRCRCCLEKFYHDERISEITSFFKSQFFSFTRMELQEDDSLSRHVCEFCHTELLRFSLYKKDLIEKQQKLNELLKIQKEKNAKFARKRKKKKIIIPEVLNEDVIVISPPKTDFKTEHDEPVDDEEIEEEEEEDETVIYSSNDEKNEDFLIVPANKDREIEVKTEVLSAAANRTYTGDRGVFKCDYCNSTFKAKRGLTRHVQSHIKNSVPWKCDVDGCEFSAKSKIKLSSHKTTAHRFTVKTPNIVNKEEIKEEKEKLVEEEVKAVKLPAKEPTEGREYICFCGACFQYARSLCAHKNRVHGGYKKCTFGCVNLQYTKTGHFIRHVQSRHPEKIEEVLKKLGPLNVRESRHPLVDETHFFQCDMCSFKTMRKSSIRSHLDRHLPYSSRPKFQCKVCKKFFTRPSSLRVHRETVHEMLRRFKCPKCPNVSFKQAGHLNDHIASKHKKMTKKHFRCNFCPQSFSKLYMVNRHIIKMHNSMRAIPGTAIPIKSKRAINGKLKKGSELHTKKFRCQALGCNLAFTARCNLLRHQKQKEHLPPNELKRIKFNCECGEKFFSHRGYAYHCEKTDCELKMDKNGDSLEKP